MAVRTPRNGIDNQCWGSCRDTPVAEDLQDTIRENAAGPKRAKGDAAEIDQHPLPDQIAADRYLASKAATKRRGLGAMFKKLVPPGTD